MIHMFWEECNEPSFYKHICKRNNFMYLNGKNVIYPQVADIVWKYLEDDEGNFDKIKKKLIENKKIFQFVYSSTYPEVYSFIEKQGIDLRNQFHLKFKDRKDKKNICKNQLKATFQKVYSPGAVQKKLVNDQDFVKQKKMAEEQKQEEMEERKQRKRE